MTIEATNQLQPEHYRNYLIVLARTLVRAGGRVHHKIDPSDLVQEVLLRAHLARSQFQGETEAELLAWLRTILANKFADATRHFARKKRDAALEQSYRETLDESVSRLRRLVPVQQTSPSQKVLRRERELQLAEALANLPDDQRTAIELHHLSGDTVAEIAEQMSCTKASVAGLLRRGLKNLREHLEKKNLE